MKHQQLNGSTMNYAETIIDYKTGKSDMKGVPDENLKDRLVTALMEWVKFLFFPGMVIIFIIYSILEYMVQVHIDNLINSLIGVLFGMILVLTSFSLNRNFDFKMKKYMAIRTGKGKRNRVRIKELKNREFVIFNTANIVVDYETLGDFNKYLSKVWVKQSHPSSVLRNQGYFDEILMNHNEPIWNVHFLFDKIPKNGMLYVEWI